MRASKLLKIAALSFCLTLLHTAATSVPQRDMESLFTSMYKNLDSAIEQVGRIQVNTSDIQNMSSNAVTRKDCDEYGGKQPDVSTDPCRNSIAAVTLRRQLRKLRHNMWHIRQSTHARTRALDAREHDLEERERELETSAIEGCEPAQPARKRAQVCEYCRGRGCEDGLACKNRICQRQGAHRNTVCSSDETCGPGQRRACRTFRSTDFARAGVLRDSLERKGFFIGTTTVVKNCVMGKVRYDCEDKKKVCMSPLGTGKEFCIDRTVAECRKEGLMRAGDPEGFGVCCVYIVPLDCFMKKICRCVAR